MLKISNRSLIPPFIVMDVMRAANERAASGSDVLHLEVGQPSSPAPKKVIETAQFVLAEDKLGYTDALGISLLREKISGYYRDTYGVNPDPKRIVITSGSSGGLLLSFLSSFDVGDCVGMATPGYPAYKNMLKSLGVKVVEVPVDSKSHFQLTRKVLDRLSEDLDGLIISSPSNPTGSMISSSGMRDLVDWCDRRGIRLISDEIYHGIVYGEQASTALSYGTDVIIINSFSKYFSMTGWRLGWMVIPENMIRSIECLAQNLYISPPSLSQMAAVVVFDCMDELNENVARYRINRDILLEKLPNAGLERFAPVDGAFYIYANVSHLTNDSSEFCKRMLSEIGVAMTPGIDFDGINGKSYVRLCFAGATQDINQAAARLQKWLI
ncbi:MAG: aminotransferase class I/II-fold pyridoxal phosphate-dependent enzyme [Rhodospirillales bacterium]